MRDEHAAVELVGEVGQDGVRRRRRVDHLLRDLREALDRARQRRGAVDERLPAVVQLAAADEHRADLGQLARLPGAAVGLRVDDEELGGRERLGEQVHERMFSRRADGCTHRLQRRRPGAAVSLALAVTEPETRSDMTTFAALPDARELEALTRAAWTTYTRRAARPRRRRLRRRRDRRMGRLQAALRELEAHARPGGRRRALT